MMVRLIVRYQLPPRVEMFVAALAVVMVGALHVMLLQSQPRIEVQIVIIADIMPL